MQPLTATSIASAIKSQATAEIHDSQIPGLSVRISARGTATFTLRYRCGGVRRSVKLGRVGVLTIDQARKRAREMLGEVASGSDPVAAQQQDRAAMRLVDLLGRSGNEGWFLSEYVHTAGKLSTSKTPLGIYNDRRNIERHLRPRVELLRMRVTDVRVEHLLAIKRSVSRGVWPKIRDILRVCFSHALECEAISQNIMTRKVLRPEPGRKMERFLSPKERSKLEDALCVALTVAPQMGGLSPHVVRAIRLCLYTGMRRGEVIMLRWEMIDWDRSVAKLPTSKTGAKEVPLSSYALAYLRSERGKAKGGLVCATESNTAICPRNLTRAWISIRAKCGLDDMRLHDCRHSMASDLLAMGAPLAVIGKVLGHTQASTTARYAHLADDTLRVHLERGAKRIADAR
jgi:integrase